MGKDSIRSVTIREVQDGSEDWPAPPATAPTSSPRRQSAELPSHLQLPQIPQVARFSVNFQGYDVRDSARRSRPEPRLGMGARVEASESGPSSGVSSRRNSGGRDERFAAASEASLAIARAPSPGNATTTVRATIRSVGAQNAHSEFAAATAVTQPRLRERIVNQELCRKRAEGGNVGLFGNLESEPGAWQSGPLRVLLDCLNNNWESKGAMLFSSVLNIFLKNMSIVGLAATPARQALVNKLIADPRFTPELKVVAASVIEAAAVGALIWGEILNRKKGTATTWSSAGRVGLGVGGLASFGLTAARGELPAAAPFFVSHALFYCGLRESLQLLVRTPGQTSKVRLGATALSGASYVVDQGVVGLLMAYLASGTTAKDDILRGIFNGSGETVDDTDLALWHSFQAGAEKALGDFLVKARAGAANVADNLRVRLSLQVPTVEEAVNMMLGSLPGRMQLFSLLAMWNALINPSIAKLPAEVQPIVSVAANAVAMGLIYCFFGAIFDSKQPARPRGWESQLEAGFGPAVELDDLRRPSAVRTQSTARLLDPTPAQSEIWNASRSEILVGA